MMIEDLVREAQERQADRAVPADRIRAALPARIVRARRHRRLAAAAGGGLVAAAVAAALVIPSLVVRRDSSPAQTPPATAVVTDPSALDVPLGYAPAWVPPGLKETERGASNPATDTDHTSAAADRKWNTVDPARFKADPALRFSSSLDESTVPALLDEARRRGREVDINGVPGILQDGALVKPERGAEHQERRIDWSPADRVFLRVVSLDPAISADDLLRMARSVAPDPGVVSMPLRFSALPAGWQVNYGVIRQSRSAPWQATVGIAKPGADLRVEVGDPGLKPEGGTSVTVGGNPARLVEPRGDTPGSMRILIIETAGRPYQAYVGTGDAAEPEVLIDIAERTEITGNGLDWLGTR